jgi:hypothetical protein
LPAVIAIATIPPLYIHNDIIHIVTVILLVSEHAFIPIFVAHIHKEVTITIWATTNLLAAIGLALLLHTHLLFITIIPKILLWTYLTYIQIYISIHGIQTETDYQERKPRVITV